MPYERVKKQLKRVDNKIVQLLTKEPAPETIRINKSAYRINTDGPVQELAQSIQAYDQRVLRNVIYMSDEKANKALEFYGIARYQLKRTARRTLRVARSLRNKMR